MQKHFKKMIDERLLKLEDESTSLSIDPSIMKP
jgi:hypothetical protein